jgi:hypothetical protein
MQPVEGREAESSGKIVTIQEHGRPGPGDAGLQAALQLDFQPLEKVRPTYGEGSALPIRCPVKGFQLFAAMAAHAVAPRWGWW